MNVEELKKKHLEAIANKEDLSTSNCFELSQEATNITISFCIGVLQDLIKPVSFKDRGLKKDIFNKIQELEKLIEK